MAVKDIPNTNMTGSHYSTGKGKVNIDIGGTGTVPPLPYGRISLTGAATIGTTATLNVTLSGGFVPAVGDIFEIIVITGTLAGEFRTKNLPALSAARWTTGKVTVGTRVKYTLTVVAA